MSKNWYIASEHGEHFVISNNEDDRPKNATPAKLSGPPTIAQIDVLYLSNCTVEVHNGPREAD